MASQQHADDNGNVVVDELDSAAVAAAMGFGSFGTQAHPNKKRRFNPQADAVVAPVRNGPAADHTKSGRLASASTTTIPSTLPQRPSSNLPPGAAQNAAKVNTDEIDLDVDEDEDEDEDDSADNPVGGASLEVADDKGETLVDDDVDDDDDGDDDDPEPQYLDTSRPIGEVRDLLGTGEEGLPLPEEDPEAVQARIDAVLAAGNATYGMTAGASSIQQHASIPLPSSQEQQFDGSALSKVHHRIHDRLQPAGIPVQDRHGFRPRLMPGSESVGDSFDDDFSSSIGGGRPSGSEDSGWTRSSDTNSSRWTGPQGGRDQRGNWWTDYYDPTSNENPWSRLESQRGLLPAPGSSWLERGHAHDQQRRGYGSERGRLSSAGSSQF